MAGRRDDDEDGLFDKQGIAHLRGWPGGIDNRSREENVPFTAARAAVNVDWTPEGKPVRRPGRTLVRALPGLHSVWASPRYPFMLGVHGGQLLGWNTSLEQFVVVPALEDPLTEMSFDFAAGSVFWTNSRDSGRIFPDGISRPWAPEAPGGQPVLTAVSGVGGFAAGTYQVAQTFIDELGRESGCALTAEITLTAGQGIGLSLIPQPQGDDTAYIRFYVSETNGKVPNFCQDVIPGTTSLTIGAFQAGKGLETQFLQPLPPGQIVRIHNGRQYVVRGRYLYWSESGHYGLGRLHANYTPYDSTITLFEPSGQAANSGVFLAAGKRTYFMAGPDPKEWSRFIAYGAGAVPGSSSVADASELGLEGTGLVPFWTTTNGKVVAGLPNGTVAQIQNDRYQAPFNAERGASVARNFKGMKHVISILRGGLVNNAAVGDSVTAEKWRDGVRIE